MLLYNALHWNEKVHKTLIDRTCSSTRGQTTLYDQRLPTNRSLSRPSSVIFWTKKINNYEKILNNSLSQSKSFQSPRSTQNTVLITMATALC